MFSKWILLPIISLSFLGSFSVLEARPHFGVQFGGGHGHHQYRHHPLDLLSTLTAFPIAHTMFKPYQYTYDRSYPFTYPYTYELLQK